MSHQDSKVAPVPSAEGLSLPEASIGASARLLFWKAQCLGWFLFGVVHFLSILPQSVFPPLVLFGFKMLWATIGLTLSSGLAVLYRRLRLADRSLGVVALVVGSASAVVATGWVLLIGQMAYLAHGATHMMYTPETFPVVVSNQFFILLAWSAGYLMIVHWQRSQARARTSLAALSHAREAQLAMLRYQLNPHFLFNAMTSVRALITTQPEQARETLTRLSGFLRYTLGSQDRQTATVAEEIEIVRDYLAIEKVRFEERLAAEIDVDPAAADERMPSFLLHTLVENGIKHGSTIDGRLKIVVTAGVVDGWLRMQVANTGRLDGSPDAGDSGGGSRVGLINVRQRLAASLPGHHDFRLEQDGDWVRATVDIQLGQTP